MTVQEVKESIEYLKMQLTEDLEMICFTGDELKALDMSIQALEEVEQYRALGTVEEIKKKIKTELPYISLAQARFKSELDEYRNIGTVEELKEAREKQVAKTPCIEGDGYCPEGHLVYDTWICPNCETDYEIDYDDYDYCPKCGQAINKSVFEGEQEDA